MIIINHHIVDNLNYPHKLISLSTILPRTLRTHPSFLPPNSIIVKIKFKTKILTRFFFPPTNQITYANQTLPTKISSPMSISGLTNTFSNPNPKIFNSASISSNKLLINGDCKLKFRVCAKVTTPESNVRVHGQFSTPVKPTTSTTSSSSSSSKTKEDEQKQDYYVNMGYAIRCLREEFPELFYKEPNFDIYRDDIVFKDPLNTFSGIENYKSIFWALRFNGKIFFKALWIEILSIWQPMENVILVRWTVHGNPRVPWESCGRFDGISEYKLDKEGKIYSHKVDNIALNSSRKFQVLSVQELILSLGIASTPKPTCFESPSPYTKLILFTGEIESVSHYLNSALDFSHRHDSETSKRS